MARGRKGLSPKKISLIHVAKSRLGMGDDDYRALLLRVGGVDSARKLDDFGFNQVMEAFQRLGFRSDFNKRNFGERPAMATVRQVALIRDLWNRFTGGTGGDAELGKWMDKHFKVSAIRFLPAETTPKVIAALTAMVAKRRPERVSGAPGT